MELVDLDYQIILRVLVCYIDELEFKLQALGKELQEKSQK